MSSDKKVLYGFSFVLFVILSLSLFYSTKFFEIFLAVFLLVYVFLVCIFIKKRSILSLYKRQISLLFLFSCLIFIVAYYLIGIKNGFYYSKYKFNLSNTFKFIIPILLIIISYEVIRYIFLSQNNKYVNILSYICGVLVEVLIASTIVQVKSFNNFMDLIGLTFLPAITSNILFQYVCKHYGYLPNIIYKVILTLYSYIIPVVPAVAEPLYALIKLIFPLIILIFIKALYEKKVKIALEKKNTLIYIFTCVIFTFVILITLLFSNQFRYGAIVIATDSMTGELNKGDIVIFEQYKGNEIKENDIILFKDGDLIVVHRVVKINDVDGELRYYTKGDANNDLDLDYRVKDDIVGQSSGKIPYFGYITLWLREIFN